MNAEALIAKLIEIGHAIGHETPKTMSFLVIEAQDFALRLQQDCVRLQMENESLRLPPFSHRV